MPGRLGGALLQHEAAVAVGAVDFALAGHVEPDPRMAERAAAVAMNDLGIDLDHLGGIGGIGSIGHGRLVSISLVAGVAPRALVAGVPPRASVDRRRGG